MGTPTRCQRRDAGAAPPFSASFSRNQASWPLFPRHPLAAASLPPLPGAQVAKRLGAHVAYRIAGDKHGPPAWNSPRWNTHTVPCDGASTGTAGRAPAAGSAPSDGRDSSLTPADAAPVASLGICERGWTQSAPSARARHTHTNGGAAISKVRACQDQKETSNWGLLLTTKSVHVRFFRNFRTRMHQLI